MVTKTRGAKPLAEFAAERNTCRICELDERAELDAYRLATAPPGRRKNGDQGGKALDTMLDWLHERGATQITRSQIVTHFRARHHLMTYDD